MATTGMFLFEIGLLNGFTAEESQTKLYNPTAKLVELDDGRVNIYFDEVNSHMLLFINNHNQSSRSGPDGRCFPAAWAV